MGQQISSEQDGCSPFAPNHLALWLYTVRNTQDVKRWYSAISTPRRISLIATRFFFCTAEHLSARYNEDGDRREEDPVNRPRDPDRNTAAPDSPSDDALVNQYPKRPWPCPDSLYPHRNTSLGTRSRAPEA